MNASAGYTLQFEATDIGKRILCALTNMGYCYRPKDGSLNQVSYKTIQTDGRYALYEVDLERLPRKVTVSALGSRRVLHDLTAIVGKPVKTLNTVGLTYCVILTPQPRGQLPDSVSLDFDRRPIGDYFIPIGQSTVRAVWRSLLSTGHILVGGKSGSGKSTWLHAALLSLLRQHTPAQLRVALVDPKTVEFTAYRTLAHSFGWADNLADASGLMESLCAEMDTRRRLFFSVTSGAARSLSDYNQHALNPLPLIVLLIDEVTELAMTAGRSSPFFANLTRLASKGRAFGFVLMLASQNPKASILDTLIKGNLGTRICFKVPTVEHSRVVLGEPGAQDLPAIPGRMLANLGDGLIALQSFNVGADLIRLVTDMWSVEPVTARLQEKHLLSVLECELVGCALHQLGGAFHIDKLAEIFKGRISRVRLSELAQHWESVGWLTATTRGANPQPRQLTPLLISCFTSSIHTDDSRSRE